MGGVVCSLSDVIGNSPSLAVAGPRRGAIGSSGGGDGAGGGGREGGVAAGGGGGGKAARRAELFLPLAEAFTTFFGGMMALLMRVSFFYSRVLVRCY